MVNVTLSQPSISVAQEGKKYNTGTQGKERVDRGKISVNTKKICLLFKCNKNKIKDLFGFTNNPFIGDVSDIFVPYTVNSREDHVTIFPD